MPEYRVVWEIELGAKNPKEAARRALEAQRDPESTATVFDIYAPGRSTPARIDLDEAGLPAPQKVYVGLSVFRGIIDEVKAFRTSSAADSFVRTYERQQHIRSAKQRKHEREQNDTYATWYECKLER